MFGNVKSHRFKIFLINVLKVVVVYSLCLIYNLVAVITIAYNAIRLYPNRFWECKERLTAPSCLSNDEFGEHHYKQVNGVRLHYVEKGDPSKPLMLFLHGFPEFWYSWRYQLKEFSRDYHCIALDMRGYGESEKPQEQSDFTIEKISDDIKAFIESIEHKSCILVCHDWGAVIGWHFITYHMDMVNQYVMMGAPSGPVWTQIMLSSWEQFRKSWYIFFFQMPTIPEFVFRMHDMDVLKSIGSGKFTDSFTEQDLEAYKYTFSTPSALKAPINYYRANLQFFKKPDTKRPSSAVPGLFILGERDVYISKASGPLQQKYFPKLSFKIVKDANHFVQQDKPDATNMLMRNFLNA